uniref:DUF1794 domain-containing protein n=1 Tax=Elaeophora elaphi TaxID=1147741 RepID=A0A0R3S6Z1_9BILA
MLYYNCLFSLGTFILITGAKTKNSESYIKKYLFAAEKCKDLDRHCFDLISQDGSQCLKSTFVKKNCLMTCMVCGEVEKKYDVRYVPELLKPLAWLIGIWRAESGGKAVFPTIPVFTYGEQIDFSLPASSLKALKALNYTAFAWDMNNREELHSEYGFITMKPNSKEVALSTVMNNGFVMIEQGPLLGKSVKLILHDIGRISFSRDLPVHGTIREFRLLDSETLEQRFLMETLTHRMQIHTSIRYKKIYPK